MKVRSIGGGDGKSKGGLFKPKKNNFKKEHDGEGEGKKKKHPHPHGKVNKKKMQNGHSNGFVPKFVDDEQKDESGLGDEPKDKKGAPSFPKKAATGGFRATKEFATAEEKKGSVGAKKRGGRNGEKAQVEMPVVKHKEGLRWHEYQIDALIEDATKDRISDEKLRELEEEADLLLRTDADLYSQLSRRQGGSETAWLQTIVKKGTSGDRQTAMTLQLKNSPVHAISFLRSMVHVVEKKNVREAMDLIPQLTELFISELLPLGRKLVSFGSRPHARIPALSSQSQQARKRLLVLWRFEHELKLVFERFTKALEAIASGAIEKLCVKCLQSAENLLAERPEQEQFLLTLLVNKLGHPNKKVAARAEECLKELARKQMNMRPIIVTEVERLIYRRNVSERAQLHAASFLSQLVLRAGESALAVQLLTIYFGLFKTLVAAKKTENKLIGVLLAGANRAFPYAKDKADSLSEDIDALYRLVHQAPFAVALQTLKLLHQVLNLSDSLTDRFYSALYRKLLDHAPVSTQQQLVDLLWKTLKSDSLETRVRAFVKRLLQLATIETAAFSARILLLVSQLLEQRPGLVTRQRKQQNELMIKETIGRGAKKDTREKRRLDDDEEDDGKKAQSDDEDDDDEEHFVDLDDDGVPLARGVKKENGDEEKDVVEMRSTVAPKKKEENKKPLAGTLPPLKTKGWVHRKNMAHHGATSSVYDVTARNPLFVSSDGAFDAELALLSKHYHPSVGVFANSILKATTLTYGGNPLEDFTTIAFLDRFVYRNPKKLENRKTTVMAPRRREARGIRSLAVKSKEYTEKHASQIPADERFLHRFASFKFGQTAVKKEGEEDWDDVGSVDSEEFEKVMARFEPGEANDEFDIDFGQEFSSEKTRKAKKRAAKDDDEEGEGEGEDGDSGAEDGEDDNADFDDEDMEDDDEDGDEDDDDEDDEDVEIEGEESDDEDFAPKRGRKGKGGLVDSDADSDDDEYGENDAFFSADRFAEEMEDWAEDETETREARKERMKRKTPGGPGKKGRGGKRR